MASNLRGAPLFLRPSVVRQLVGDLAAIRQAVVRVPLLPIKLVDRPRPSEDPRLAKANDDIAELPVAPAVAGVASGSDRVLRQAQDDREAEGSAPVVRIQAEEPEPIDWPDAPLPEHADPDLDRPEPDADHIESAATCLSNVDRAGYAALAPEGTSGEVACVGMSSPANASEQPTESKVCSRLPVKESGLDGMAARESVNPTQRALPDPLRNTAGEKHSPTIQPALRNLGRRKSVQKAIEIEEPKAGRERIRAMAEKLAAKRRAEAGIDYAKLAEAHRNSSGARPASARVARPLEPAPSREECPRCGIPGWKGCDHFLPCADQPKAPPEERYVGDRKSQQFTGRRQGIGASRL